MEGMPSFGRQMGSYPLLVGIPVRLTSGVVIDAVVVDHGMRSVTALPLPVDVNALPASALSWLPGVGKAKARTIASRRPISGLDEFRSLVGATPLDNHLSFVRYP